MFRTGHIRGNVFGSFPGSGKAFVGRHRPPQWPKMARNGPFAAISNPGGRKMVDKSCSRFDMDKANLGQWVEPFPGSGKVFGGGGATAPKSIRKWPKMALMQAVYGAP